MSNTAPQLRPIKIIFDAFALVWIRRTDFFHALWVPFLFIVVNTLTWDFLAGKLSPSFRWLSVFTYSFLFTFFAVNCHRVVLLNIEPVGTWAVPKWSRRETKFLCWGIIIWLIVVSLIFFSTAVALMFVESFHNTQFLNQPSASPYIQMAVSLIYCYLFARISLVLPSIAVDKQLRLKESLLMSKGNGWRLMVSVSLMPWLLKAIADNLFNNDTNTFEYVLYTSIFTALLAVEVVALSISYRELVTQTTESEFSKPE